MTIDYTFRLATITDTEIIADQRTLMFAEIGKVSIETLTENLKYYVPWLAEQLNSGNYIGILVEHGQGVVAGSGFWISIGAPLPNLQSSDLRRATIVNVYTHPDHRGKGLAREMMTRLLDIAKEIGCPVTNLHASDAGRHLYESMGFSDTNELQRLL